NWTKVIHKFCQANAGNEAMAEFVEPLVAYNKEWGEFTTALGMQAMQNIDNVGAASVDYLMYSGYVTLAYFWAAMAAVAQQKLDEGTTEEDFYKAKIATARFYFKRILPRSAGHKGAAEGGLDCLMEIDEEHFAFRSEEHTSELQSRFDLVCRLLLEKKKHKRAPTHELKK